MLTDATTRWGRLICGLQRWLYLIEDLQRSIWTGWTRGPLIVSMHGILLSQLGGGRGTPTAIRTAHEVPSWLEQLSFWCLHFSSKLVFFTRARRHYTPGVLQCFFFCVILRSDTFTGERHQQRSPAFEKGALIFNFAALSSQIAVENVSPVLFVLIFFTICFSRLFSSEMRSVYPGLISSPYTPLVV